MEIARALFYPFHSSSRNTTLETKRIVTVKWPRILLQLCRKTRGFPDQILSTLFIFQAFGNINAMAKFNIKSPLAVNASANNFPGIIISLQRLICSNTVYISNSIIFVELFTGNGGKWIAFASFFSAFVHQKNVRRTGGRQSRPVCGWLALHEPKQTYEYMGGCGVKAALRLLLLQFTGFDLNGIYLTHRVALNRIAYSLWTRTSVRCCAREIGNACTSFRQLIRVLIE